MTQTPETADLSDRLEYWSDESGLLVTRDSLVALLRESMENVGVLYEQAEDYTPYGGAYVKAVDTFEKQRFLGAHECLRQLIDGLEQL